MFEYFTEFTSFLIDTAGNVASYFKNLLPNDLSIHRQEEPQEEEANDEAVDQDVLLAESQRLCDLCKMYGTTECSLHAKLRLSMSKRRYDDFKIFREDVFDSKRDRDIFFDQCNEDRYKAIIENGVWTLSYIGKVSDTRIVDAEGELGKLAFGRKVQRICLVCVATNWKCCPEHSIK